jgi:hypothetical protein
VQRPAGAAVAALPDVVHDLGRGSHVDEVERPSVAQVRVQFLQPLFHQRRARLVKDSDQFEVAAPGLVVASSE